MTPSTLLIFGASARAAAQSARRAGLEPYGIDLFADQDLLECCPAVAVAPFPQGLLAAARGAPPGDWLYTGGLENHPLVVDRIAAERRLLGNSGNVLRRVRDPLLLERLFSLRVIACPEVAVTPDGLPTDGSWLRKPSRSAGGQGIAPWRGAVLESDGGKHRRRGEWYYQARVDGVPVSAVFVGHGGDARLLGVTEQLIGTSWCGAADFAYAGSLGPLALSEADRTQWERIGLALAEEFGLIGLFGVDAILSRGVLWPVEVNPRYTASIEVLERAIEFSAVALHVAACCEGNLPAVQSLSSSTCCGKAVLYAQADAMVDDGLSNGLLKLRGEPSLPMLADLPRVGSAIHRGWPLLTLLAEGSSRGETLERLRAISQSVQSVLANS